MSGKKGIFANGKDSDPSYQHSTNQALTHTVRKPSHCLHPHNSQPLRNQRATPRQTVFDKHQTNTL